ncbi:hypothetical protein [Bradyrhizobium sp. LTSPM299]|uniref:hypothetical protein n=1 Tax=Bradyrhizobium sp. LTSPM299 TaxID=1619233 RepID=UPI000AE2C686|nr:hypothetical protein [Bradyrhizobium sp. LTSPM299]
MNSYIRLDQLADYFPATSQSAPVAANANFPLRLGNNLQNRLVTLVLGLGAIDARFDPTCNEPTLVARSSRGAEIRTVISGPEWQWHKALDQFAALYDEDERAGLYRYLNSHQMAHLARRRTPTVKGNTRQLDTLMLLAA